MQKNRQGSIIFEKPGILPKRLRTFASSNYRRVEYTLLKFCTHFPHLSMSVIEFSWFFNFV